MRFTLYTLFSLAWIGMWWWTYVYHIKCPRTSLQSDMQAQYVANATLPLSFRWSDPRPVISDDFAGWRDSLVSLLGRDHLLQITGMSFRDEIPPEGVPDLGLFRAEGIARAFGPTLRSEQFVLASAIGDVTAHIKDRNFAGYRLRIMTRNTDVYEMTNCSWVRFPYDSISQIKGSMIQDYAKKLQQQLQITGESVKLISLAEQQDDTAGHTLTQSRRAVLKEIFIKAGVSESKVLLDIEKDVSAFDCDEMPDRDETQDWISVIFVK